MVLCFSLVVLTLSMTNAWAQNSSLNGTVTDPGGGVIPGSEVTITLMATGAQRLAVTDDQGRYSFSQMAPGIYEIAVELTGFKRLVVPNVVLAVDTPARLDVKLELGFSRNSHFVLATGPGRESTSSRRGFPTCVIGCRPASRPKAPYRKPPRSERIRGPPQSAGAPLRLASLRCSANSNRSASTNCLRKSAEAAWE